MSDYTPYSGSLSNPVVNGTVGGIDYTLVYGGAGYPDNYLHSIPTSSLLRSVSAPVPGPAAVATSTGVNPTETSYSLYGHTVPLSVFGVGRIGGEIIAGPWIENGAASFIISFGMPADPSGTRALREIAFDSEVVWDSVNGFSNEGFTYRFYGGSLTQAADALEIAHFGGDAVAYRPQMLIAFENLPLANTKYGKIPYVAAVIADASGDDVNLGEAFERIAYSPWVGWTSDQFETSGITDGLVSGGLIIAQDSDFLSTIQQFGRFYPSWDILQTDKLRIVDRGATVSADIILNKTRLMDAVTVVRQGPDSIKKDLELSTIDPDADYTIVPSVAQRPRDPVAVTTSIGKDAAYLPAIMDSSTRTAIVTYAKYHEEATRKSISGTAMAYGLEIEPGTLVAIRDLGDDFNNETFKISETLHGANNVVEFTAAAILRCSIGDDESSAAMVAASDTTYATSASQDQTIPAETAVGDLLIAVIMHRDTLTPPTGWALVASATCTNSAPITQFTSVYKRIAQSGDGGGLTTWTQATSQRIATHIMVVRKSGGCDVVDFGTASQSNDTTASNVAIMATATATANGQLGLAFASSILASSAVVFPTTVMQASVGWTLTTPSDVVANRLGAAYRSRSNNEATSGTFNNDVNGGFNNGWACVSLVIG